eukprot:Colp12_sorted_trinity150504_noHs@15590
MAILSALAFLPVLAVLHSMAFFTSLGLVRKNIHVYISDFLVETMKISVDKVPIAVVLITIGLGLLMHIIAVVAFSAKKGSFVDNRNPRTDKAALKGGFASWAHGAHENTNETLAPLIGALFAASVLNAPQDSVVAFVSIFVACRVLFCLFYLTGASTLRSFVYLVGYHSLIHIFLISLYDTKCLLNFFDTVIDSKLKGLF